MALKSRRIIITTRIMFIILLHEADIYPITLASPGEAAALVPVHHDVDV